MATYTELTEKAADQILSAVKPLTDLTKTITDAASEGASKLPTLPSLPRPEGVPTALEVLTAHFALAERLLTAQKDFALGLAGTAAPVKAKATAKA